MASGPLDFFFLFNPPPPPVHQLFPNYSPSAVFQSQHSEVSEETVLHLFHFKRHQLSDSKRCIFVLMQCISDTMGFRQHKPSPSLYWELAGMKRR